MKVSSLCAVALLAAAIGCGTQVETKVAKSSVGEKQPNTAADLDFESGTESEVKATYTSNRGESEPMDAGRKNKNPTAASALANALKTAAANDKNLLVHFGSPG